MSTAAVGASDAAATFTFESGETRALTGSAIANAFVAALTVEVCLVPFLCVICTSQTISIVVLFANKTVGVLVLDLLVRVQMSVCVYITERRVDERFAVQTQAVRAIVSQEVKFAFANTSGVADTVA